MLELSWIDPNTEERRQPSLETPVAIGKEFTQMPQESNGKRISRIVIKDDLIADYHALINWQDDELIITDQNTKNGIKINGIQLTYAKLQNGDRIQIGTCEIVVNFVKPAVVECDRMIGFLFKRRCGRTDRTDCLYCTQEYENNHPYYYDYTYYDGYGVYRSGYWGSDYYSELDRYCYSPETGNVDFTEADCVSLEEERDGDFEINMGAS
ncbi:FHA domain-containing protein [Chlorogloeopsis sp. ULAP01]|uniref:FHA domain-containing protein n=1 Tax=Chlorogloeopsis sp. ULAP01 TaxID=3056483 RepID=UPI0025AAEA22|nr:FHA domain-containing protein [Chlorogloeopsis sp. ULAP01]MDM9384398.1 FHA domain-containing protein [Chlorogloeopsis sp. ULAP01]